MIIDEESYIKHFGVMGMRWGVRNKSKKSIKSKREPERTTYKEGRKPLSENELNRRIERLEKERLYSELNAPTQASGEIFAKSMLDLVGKTLIGAAIGTTASFFIGRYFRGKFG